MSPSTPTSNSTSKGSHVAPTPRTYLTRSRIQLAERIQKRINQLHGDYSPGKGKRDGYLMSPSPAKFSRERMLRAKSGHFRRPSLETSCLIARGEHVAKFCTSMALDPSSPSPSVQDTPLSQQQVICTSSSSWGESPSFASPDCSSNPNVSRLGFSSLPSDYSPVNLESHPCKSTRAQIQTRLRGNTRTASGSFVNEMVGEEVSNVEPPLPAIKTLQLGSLDVFRTRKSPRATLRKYYALKNEVETTVSESKKLWSDTPYSTSEVQNFQPPRDVETIQSIIQDSMKNYRPLPSELRLHRRRSSRSYSRMSPYSQARINRLMTSPQKTIQWQSPSRKRTSGIITEAISLPDALTNRNSFASPAPKKPGVKPSTPFTADKAKTLKEAPKCSSPLNMRSAPRPALSLARPPMPGQSPSKTRYSTSRMSSKHAVPTSGLTKREQKNKENILLEPPKTPSGSLRTDRPRPRYRTPTPCPKRRLAKK